MWEDFEGIFARYVSKSQVERLLEEAKKGAPCEGEEVAPAGGSESKHGGNGVADQVI